MKNKDVRQLEDDLISLLNQSPVLIATKVLILENVLRQANEQANKAIIEELEEERNAKSVQPDLLGEFSES